jgi:hypothetical protein
LIPSSSSFLFRANTRGGNDYGASGVVALNKKELEEGINRMVE